MGNKSFIDHFLFSKNTNFNDIDIAYDGNNLSDHNPLAIKVYYNTELTQLCETKNKIMNWNKATKTNLQNYKTHVNHYVGQLEIPEEVLNCNNLLCKNHDKIILQKLDELIDILIISAHDTIPVQAIHNKKGIPGWNNFVKPYKEK